MDTYTNDPELDPTWNVYNVTVVNSGPFSNLR
jgi:hypothetical protein